MGVSTGRRENCGQTPLGTVSLRKVSGQSERKVYSCSTNLVAQTKDMDSLMVLQTRVWNHGCVAPHPSGASKGDPSDFLPPFPSHPSFFYDLNPG